MLSSFQPILYIQISPERVCVRNVKTGKTVSELAEIAVTTQAKPVIRAIGSAARLAGAEPGVALVKPFAHPRSLVSDFTLGEHVLKEMIHRCLGRSLFSISPAIILHLMGDPEGGFTQVEIRAFREMTLACGAAQVTLWQGRNLTDQELQSRQFPAEGKVLS
jgi:rod shape-determining protein MreB